MAKRRKLLRELFQTYLLITLLSLFVIIVFTAESLKMFHIGQLSKDLEIQSELFRQFIPADLSPAAAQNVNQLCRSMGTQTGTRFTVILANGVVVGDSDENYQVMANHADRPEIVSALSGGVGISRRYSSTMNSMYMYVGIPVYRDDAVIGVVRASLPENDITATLHHMYYRIAGALFLIGLFSTLASFWISRNINTQIAEISRGADHFADGDLGFRIPASNLEELDTLAVRMNEMAGQLDERIHTITEQRNTIEAVLSGMTEAVVAIDTRETIIEFNESAEKLFHMTPENLHGRKIQEIIRNAQIHEFIEKVKTEHGPVEKEIILHTDRNQVLQIHGSRLFRANGEFMGAVFVFNDITNLKKLETIRSDFVANVSHELKTPITSIIGFSETMAEEMEKGENIGRFMDIVLKNARRLDSIIDDLLCLSRMEQETEKKTIQFERTDICEILTSAVSHYETHRKTRNMEIELECAPAFISGNATLLIQAVGNLIDNAIKYSERGSRIHVSSLIQDSTVDIRVKDPGCGIPPAHQSRIFERFYRVDKSRSRELGGTGLGLSIVKHIILIHGGQVSVESRPGKGSTFTITLPIA